MLKISQYKPKKKPSTKHGAVFGALMGIVVGVLMVAIFHEPNVQPDWFRSRAYGSIVGCVLVANYPAIAQVAITCFQMFFP